MAEFATVKGVVIIIEFQEGDPDFTAFKKAAAGDYPTGIAMLLDATKEVRRALRMVGVSQ